MNKECKRCFYEWRTKWTGAISNGRETGLSWQECRRCGFVGPRALSVVRDVSEVSADA